MSNHVSEGLSGYDELAFEYYDSKRHPTSANFRYLSADWIEGYLLEVKKGFSHCLEVGAGRSIVAELRARADVQIDRLTISDKSKEMLSHSHELRDYYEDEVLLDVENRNSIRELIIDDLDLVVSSLGDPYNSPNFWESMGMLLSPGAKVLFTSPSIEWARSFRKDNQEADYDAAEFLSKDKGPVRVRSTILCPDSQARLCKSSGFRTDLVEPIFCDSIPRRKLSWKLEHVSKNRLPALVGYVFSKK